MPRRPSSGLVTQGYGPRINPVTGRQESHHGEDINSAGGLTLVAPEPCQLVSYGVVAGWEVHGRVAILEGASGWVHWLSHTDRPVPGRSVGDTLAEGDPAAVMGLTGQTTGLHVHWETRWHGVRLDPEAWLTQTAATDSHPFTPAPKEHHTMYGIRQAGVPNSGVIIRDTAAPNSMLDQVFDAVTGGLGLEVRELADWQYQTVIREQWAAHIADKTARGQDGTLDPLDLDALAQAVRDALTGTTFTLTTK